MRHPASDPACFQLDDGWSLRLVVDAALRRATDIDIPEPLAPEIGLHRDDVRLFRPQSGSGPELTVRRGRRRTRCFGALPALVPARARDGDLVFLTLADDHYRVTLYARPQADDPIALVAALVGTEPDEDDGTLFWFRVARRLGQPQCEPTELARRVRARGDEDLAVAIEATTRLRRGSGGWMPGWDLAAPLHPDQRFLAVVSGSRCRVALGVADPRDHLPPQYLITEGGIVWVEVDQPEDARRHRELLSPDVIAPAQSDRWVRWLRLEHVVRQVSLSGGAWQLLPDGDAWRLAGVEGALSLHQALEVLEHAPRGEIRAATHLRHAVPRSVLAVDRAASMAYRRGIVAVERDTRVGFASAWRDGNRSSSSMLGVLLAI